MKNLSILFGFSRSIQRNMVCSVTRHSFSTLREDPQLHEMIEFLDNLKNFEKSGVPKDAGTDSKHGFDLGRMKRLMGLMGNPQSTFKTVHIAGTKGKGSTAAFLSSILRAEGYSVGCYTSPHIQTIRERITLGRWGEPVSAKALNHHFKRRREVIERAVKLENGCLSHFEVFTAIAFSLFAEENTEIAVVEAGLGGARDATNVISGSDLAISIITTVGEEHLDALGGSLESIAVAKSGIVKNGRPLVIGGPFIPSIECILRRKASSMSSPVVSASDPGNRSALRGFCEVSGIPRQLCDIVLQIEKDFDLAIELLGVKLRMLGAHQLQNAVTATCAALCLNKQGWSLSSGSIRSGLESAFLQGRSQILSSEEANLLGVPGATVLLDGAHTKESARALANTLQMTFPKAKMVLVVAMANDKDHLGFARELLSVGDLDAVFFTEVDIAGAKSRMTSASLLKCAWVNASREMDMKVLDLKVADSEDQSLQAAGIVESRSILLAAGSLLACMGAGFKILSERTGEQPGIIVVTGSLHIVSTVLGYLHS
ncbi:dihydrofolate synthetase [Lycium ferocissimum]|uniref:dihydrofolate synthetase n=1 Tax=Lycium ferocissimum TaxID=112874 RepID=UPI002815AA0B|nr:dihydrofolate synthetase [Lycium ferocissimum]XP_059298860.1 dihydrofolate synthetase [Lycium ferocissimum]